MCLTRTIERVRRITELGMVTHLVRDFLTNPQGYDAARRFWLGLWGLEVVPGEWELPWVANRLADGSELRDANPIFIAFSPVLRRGLRLFSTSQRSSPSGK